MFSHDVTHIQMHASGILSQSELNFISIKLKNIIRKCLFKLFIAMAMSTEMVN